MFPRFIQLCLISFSYFDYYVNCERVLLLWNSDESVRAILHSLQLKVTNYKQIWPALHCHHASRTTELLVFSWKPILQKQSACYVTSGGEAATLSFYCGNIRVFRNTSTAICSLHNFRTQTPFVKRTGSVKQPLVFMFLLIFLLLNYRSINARC